MKTITVQKVKTYATLKNGKEVQIISKKAFWISIAILLIVISYGFWNIAANFNIFLTWNKGICTIIEVQKPSMRHYIVTGSCLYDNVPISIKADYYGRYTKPDNIGEQTTMFWNKLQNGEYQGRVYLKEDSMFGILSLIFFIFILIIIKTKIKPIDSECYKEMTKKV